MMLRSVHDRVPVLSERLVMSAADAGQPDEVLKESVRRIQVWRSLAQHLLRVGKRWTADGFSSQ